MSELQKRIQYIFFALALILSISCSTLSSLVSGDSLKAPSLFSGPSFEVISPLNFERLSLLAKVPFFIDCHSYFMDEKKTVLFCDSVIAIYSTLKPEPHPIKVQETSSIQWTAFSPDWTRMVAVLGYGEKSTLWDLEKGVRISEFPVEITKAVFSPDGKTIATVNVWPEKDNATVRLWDASDGKAIRALSIENHSGSDVAFSDDGKTIAVGTFMPGDAFLWDMQSDQPSIYFPADSSMWVGFSATEKMIITGWGDFHVWDIASGKELTFLQSAHNGNVQGVAFNPDDSLIATWGEDRKARVWETAGGVERSFENLSDSIIGDAGFSPDGKRFSVLNKNTISEWDAATGKLLVSADLTTDCGELKALNPDWQLAVCAAKDGTLMVWDILEGKALTVLKVEKQFSLQGKYIQFSSDGKLLSADYSGYLDDEYVWRLLVFGVR